MSRSSFFYLKQAVEPSLQHNKRGRDNVQATHRHTHRTHVTTDTPKHTDIDKHRFGHQTPPNHPQDAKRQSQNVVKCTWYFANRVPLGGHGGPHQQSCVVLLLPTLIGNKSDKVCEGRNNCMRELFTFASTDDMDDALCFCGW